MSDYVRDDMRMWYVHPETGVIINDEDMPWELIPEE